jgi:hypothetical protein
MDSLVSYDHHHKGLVDADDLSIDSSTIAAKNGGGRDWLRRLQQQEDQRKQNTCCSYPSIITSLNRPWTYLATKNSMKAEDCSLF